MIRLCCAVPGCRRTRGRHKGEPEIIEGQEWICGEHWRLVPLMRRRVLYRLRTQAAAAKGLARAQFQMRADDTWHALKRMAIERAAGL